MKIRVASREFDGRAVDLTDVSVTAQAVVNAISGDSPQISIECEPPGLVHEFVGHIHAGITISRRSALAAAARSRGMTTPHDAELQTVNARLTELEPPAITVRSARKRVAETGAECERLQESVAAQRGRVQALREIGEDATDAETELRDTIAALSEQETERLAAEQALTQAEKQAREARNQRERRLRLEDSAANLQRAARRSLAAEVTPAFEEAVADVPEGTPEAVATALAVARIAEIRAPVVLAEPWFETSTVAADWLSTPVIRL